MYNENHEQKNVLFPTIFGWNSQVISENISDEKCFLYRSVRPQTPIKINAAVAYRLHSIVT